MILMNKIGAFPGEFEIGTQADSHDFMIKLIDNLT